MGKEEWSKKIPSNQEGTLSNGRRRSRRRKASEIGRRARRRPSCGSTRTSGDKKTRRGNGATARRTELRGKSRGRGGRGPPPLGLPGRSGRSSPRTAMTTKSEFEQGSVIIWFDNYNELYEVIMNK